MIKTQPLSSKRLSPSKGDKCTKNYIRRLSRTRAINIRLSQVTLTYGTMEEKDAKAELWGRHKTTSPIARESNLTVTCQRKRFRAGLSAARRGLNTDHLSFILKPCYLSELLGFLLLPGRFDQRSMQLSCVYMAHCGGESWQTSN